MIERECRSINPHAIRPRLTELGTVGEANLLATLSHPNSMERVTKSQHNGIDMGDHKRSKPPPPNSCSNLLQRKHLMLMAPRITDTSIKIFHALLTAGIFVRNLMDPDINLIYTWIIFNSSTI
jgi:hypothetical protein